MQSRGLPRLFRHIANPHALTSHHITKVEQQFASPIRSIQHQQQDIRRCLSIYCYGTRTLASCRRLPLSDTSPRWPSVRLVRPGALAALSTRQSTTQQSRAAMTPAQSVRLGYNTYSDLDISGTSTGIMYMTKFVLMSDLEEELGQTSPSGLATLAVVSNMSCPRGPLWCRW